MSLPRLAWQASSAGIRRFSCAIGLAACGALLLLPASPAPAAKVVRPRLVQTIQTSAFSPASPDPSGIVYRPGRDRFLISDSEVDEMVWYQGFNLFTAGRRGGGFGSGTTLPDNEEPTDLGLNPRTGTLFIPDDDRDSISVVQGGRTSVVRTSAFGSGDPEGVEYDPASHWLFVCDGFDREIYRVNPVNGRFGDGNDRVTHFDLARYGARDCEGLGIDPRGQNKLLAVDWETDSIYELSTGGRLLRRFNLAGIPTRSSTVADVTLAPSSNRNDRPSRKSYWIVDRHVDNTGNALENDGLLYEMSLGG